MRGAFVIHIAGTYQELANSWGLAVGSQNALPQPEIPAHVPKSQCHGALRQVIPTFL